MLNAAPWLLDLTAGLEPIPRALVVLGAVLAAVGHRRGAGFGDRPGARGSSAGRALGHGPVAGGLVGAAQALLIIWLAGGLLAAGPFPTLGQRSAQSDGRPRVDEYLPPPIEVVGEIAGALDASGLPDVFVGLEPLPAPPVDTPTDPQAARIARGGVEGTARDLDPRLRHAGHRHRRSSSPLATW